jgi:gluconolactonase
LRLVADNLSRPEGVLATRDGRVIVASSAAACTIIAPDGARRDVGRAHHVNGIAMDREGRLIVANYGLIDGVPGSLQRVDLQTGATTDLATHIDGRALTSSNSPALGPFGEIYCTHTQWRDPYNIGATEAAGFVYAVGAGGARLVHGGLRMANGLCFGRDFSELFVAQTASADVVRLRRTEHGGYGEPRSWGPPLGRAPDNISAAEIRAMDPHARSELGHVDGLALDVAGNLWVTLPFANAIAVITPQGEKIEILRDREGERLRHVTNIAFGGADLRTLYIASMRTNSVWRLRVDIPGLPLPHWR